MWSTNTESHGRFAIGLATPFMPPNNDELARFHDGDRQTLAALYEQHFDDVTAAVGTILKGADRETVVHEVFLSLIDDAHLRQNFQGGSMAGWLRTVARNRAIDHHRKYIERERPLPSETADAVASPHQTEDELGGRLDAKKFLEQIRAAVPDKWLAVFEARFVKQLSQRDAALVCKTHRTTLAYQELQLRRLLRRILKESRGT